MPDTHDEVPGEDRLVAEMVATMHARADAVTPSATPYARFRSVRARRAQRARVAVAAAAAVLALAGGTAWAGYAAGERSGVAAGFDDAEPYKVTEQCGRQEIAGTEVTLLKGEAKAKADAAADAYDEAFRQSPDGAASSADRQLVYEVVCAYDKFGGVAGLDVRLLWSGGMPTGGNGVVLAFTRGTETIQEFAVPGRRGGGVWPAEHRQGPWLLSELGSRNWAVFATPATRVELRDTSTGEVVAQGVTDTDGFATMVATKPIMPGKAATTLVRADGGRVDGPGAWTAETSALSCHVAQNRDSCPNPWDVPFTMPTMENWSPDK
ncbi:hypothetical protein [Yinghuangia seranimata]|uniref:hypothetical protein n=1 Tax=Yinghuangia seranimata TaxID=408067 RepID=UPI00248AA3D2|nr:hypothetical protein [Yinghuangia seranimata]MDI2126385.1 hypothetical protein [Yinghuangia seranimata]